MIEYVAQNQLFPTLLGAQTVDADAMYRPISFCLLQTVDGAQVAYNALTCELLELTADEAAALSGKEIKGSEASRALIEKYFLVPTAHDDFGFAREVLEMAKLFRKPGKKAIYTVLTTTDCNARCFYCYELGAKRVPMSQGTAKDVAAFILRTHGDGEVLFRWFGGEPLYNAEAIDIICSTLRDAGVSYKSTMVSNAYLFDDAMVEKARTLWNLFDVQVTLDGTEAVYNKAKAFIYKDGRSAFAVVTDNIARLLAAKIHVAVRLNMGDYNRDDLYALAEWMAARYPEKKYLRVYAHLLFENKAPTVDGIADLRMLRATELVDFEDFLVAHGLSKVAPFKNELKVSCCGLDSDRTLVVLPDGRLTKCEHMLEDGFVGDIYKGVTETALIETFKERIDDREMCAGCPALPDCVQLRHCPNESHYICDAGKRMIKVASLRRGVEATYRAEKKKAAEKSAE